MALSCRGHEVLSLGELNELLGNLKPAESGTGLLQAWILGQEPPPEAAWVLFAVEGPAMALNDDALEVCATARERLEEAFPEEIGRELD